MGRDRSKLVSHVPVWVAAPLKIDRAGNTKPGFLCIHELENGNGLCAGNTFEKDDSPHYCYVKLRGRWNISRPCYDKPHRCPGWAGGGWKSAKYQYCRDGGRPNIDYERRGYSWRMHTCSGCGVRILPIKVKWTSLSTWWWEIKHFRSRLWFYRIETWVGKKLGRW